MVLQYFSTVVCILISSGFKIISVSYFNSTWILQIPLFIYWIVAVRQMAMASHPGFDTVSFLPSL